MGSKKLEVAAAHYVNKFECLKFNFAIEIESCELNWS